MIFNLILLNSILNPSFLKEVFLEKLLINVWLKIWTYYHYACTTEK